jgi:hypothetical protein
MTSLNKGFRTMQKLLPKLQAAFPHLIFSPGKQFCWSPESQEIFYKIDADSDQSSWSLLHETGHALLEHTTYHADFELLKLEVGAWEKAKELAQKFGIEIDEEHIQDCLDTYRDWLYKRSICPSCTNKCLQQDDFIHYRCFNCHTVWRVSTSRFCRAYRATKNVPQTAAFLLEIPNN